MTRDRIGADEVKDMPRYKSSLFVQDKVARYENGKLVEYVNPDLIDYENYEPAHAKQDR